MTNKAIDLTYPRRQLDLFDRDKPSILTYSAWAVLWALLLPVPMMVTGQPVSFPIAERGVAISMSFDGGRYLVGVEDHRTSPTTLAAQLLDAEGSKVGALIPTGRSGITTALAFDGVNHLMIWEDNELGTLNENTGWKVYGQFFSTQGTALGEPFAITSAGIWFDGIKTLAFGAGRYLVTYTRLIVPSRGHEGDNRYIAGRILEPNGTLGEEFRISTGFGKASDVAFDGVNFFVVWCEDYNDREIRGRFVSPAGVPGTEVLVNTGQAPSDNPKSVAFDGTNYLVVWNEEVQGMDTGTWDSFGQLLSPEGALVGERIMITTEPGPQMVTTVSFDGDNYLPVWVDMLNESDWNLYGQFVNQAGALVGGKVTLSTEPGNQLGGAGAANGRHLVMVNHGVNFGPGGISEVQSATGFFVEPLPSLQITTGAETFGIKPGGFSFELRGPDGQTVLVERSSDLGGSVWSTVQTNALVDGTATFTDPDWTNASIRFYRVRSQ